MMSKNKSENNVNENINVYDQLVDHLEYGKDWERLDTPTAGVWVVKVPGGKNSPAKLYLEFNPLDDFGKPMKRKGVFIGNKELLVKLVEAFSDDITYQLIQYLEKINPKSKAVIAAKRLKMD